MSDVQKQNDKLISVIVPVYNVAPYLTECLKSICAQTYRELEIILIDDGSTDESGDICEEWSRKDNRIRVFHQQNAGVSSARNAGLEVCTGDLISFVDSDDWLDLEMIEKLVGCLDENQADAAMCGFVDYPHGAPVEKGVFSVAPCDFKGVIYQMMRRNGYFTSPWAKLFRRELIFRDGQFTRFDQDLAFGEDEVWLLEVLRNCELTAFLPQPLYYWRPREESVSRCDTLTDKKMTILEAKAKFLCLLPDDAAIRTLARARLYNDCFEFKVQAYCAGNTAALHRISQAIRPMWRDWVLSDNYIFLRKCKVLILNVEMLLKLPKRLVERTNALTH